MLGFGLQQPDSHACLCCCLPPRVQDTLLLWTAIWGARVSTVVCPLGITSDHVIVPEEVLECGSFFTRTIKRLFENHCTTSGVYNYRYLAAPRLENSLARVLTSTPYLVGNWWNPLACAEELDLAWSSSFGCSCPVCPAMASGPVTSQAARIASHHPHLWTLGCLSLIAPSWGFKFRKHSTNGLAESSSCLLTTCGPRGGGPPLPPGSLQSDSCLLLITQALVLLFNLAASQVVEGEKQDLSW